MGHEKDLFKYALCSFFITKHLLVTDSFLNVNIGTKERSNRKQVDRCQQYASVSSWHLLMSCCDKSMFCFILWLFKNNEFWFHVSNQFGGETAHWFTSKHRVKQQGWTMTWYKPWDAINMFTIRPFKTFFYNLLSLNFMYRSL